MAASPPPHSHRLHRIPTTAPAVPVQVGNYGGAWYRQGKEFSEFPGAILMTVGGWVVLPALKS